MKKFLLKYLGIPKIIITFQVDGCMGHINTFKNIGYVRKEYTKNGVDYYDVKVIHNGSDFRDSEIQDELAYQIQHLYFNLYICYK